MHLRISMPVFLVVTVLATGPAFSAGCVVADPTGTPLNVRSDPKGRVLSVLDNGVAVQVIDEVSVAGKRWVRIATEQGALGWVFAAYLDCMSAGHSLKSAPMRPRTAPE